MTYINNFKKILLGLILLAIPAAYAHSQVDFKVELLPDNTTYQVSLIPSVTWSGVQALTATGQVTLTVPTGGFNISNLQSVNGSWSNNSTVIAPDENPGTDYLTVGLVSLGTQDIEYDAGVETVLFTFENGGDCTGPLALMESGDLFSPPNSQNANVGNQITTLGGGNTNAWMGNIGVADCSGGMMEIMGCIDNTACNYNPTATQDDNSCEFTSCAGCTDATACNYDVTATIDDGSCTAPDADCDCGPIVAGCTDATATNFDPAACSDDGSCIIVVIVEGCTDPNACNYNANANTEDNSCIQPDADCDCGPIVAGCTDAAAFNYDAAACQDDGSCVPVVMGCTDANACNFDPAANTDAGCIAPDTDCDCGPIVAGCTDATAINFDATACSDDGSCIAVVMGCTDANACNFDANANTDDNSCIAPDTDCDCGPIVAGCTDAAATNYDAAACQDDGSCVLPLVGCTDPNACNFNANANTDDGSCIAPDVDCGCDAIILGCTDASAINFDATACLDDGSCIATVMGCTDANACNFDANANTDNGSCIDPDTDCDCGPIVAGCTDVNATNYDAAACQDDGSCQAGGTVDYVIAKDDATDVISVSLVPSVDWAGNLGITSTGQVTLLVPTGGFTVGNVTSMNGTWSANSIVVAPSENPGFDYITFGLTSLGTSDIEYVANQETLLFTFENIGECVATIDLMETGDAFTPPNSQSANVGNQITTLGGGNVNSWAGNVGSVDCDCAPDPIFGCIDATACNFDMAANTEDGSCVYGIAGCPDPCNAELGCTDAAATNFDPAATCDDGSCEFVDGTVQYVIAKDDATDIISVSLMPNVDWSGAQGITSTAQVTIVVPTGGFQVGNVTSVSGTWSANSIVIAPSENPGFDYITFGLTSLGTMDIDYAAGQETLLFTFDNAGDCVETLDLMETGDAFSPPNSESANVGNQITTLGGGNTNSWAGNIGSVACDCAPDPIFGCIDATACNFDMAANTEDGSCVYGIAGCPDPCNAVLGCTDPMSAGYNPAATCDDGSCPGPIGTVQYVIEKDDATDVISVSLVPSVTWAGADGITSTGQVTLLVPTGGFQVGNVTSMNGTWSANSIVVAPSENPGFDYITFGLTSLGTTDIEYVQDQETLLFTFENTGDCVATIDLMATGDAFTPPNSESANVGNQITTLGGGNTNSWAGNIGSVACDCEPIVVIINGCIDVTACNYDMAANTEDGSCVYGIAGCPDPCNAELGCTDIEALNYSPTATCEDGSCEYEIDPPVAGTVQFVIEKDENTEVVSVSALPNVSWSGAQGITSTAQVTLLVPTGGFQVGNITSVNGSWSANSIVIAPSENPGFDYITFGLVSLGTSEIEYVAGQETLLFTFENAGDCVETIVLMETGDVFTPPNTESANVGNQITTLGGGNNNVWSGNIGSVACDCIAPLPVGCTDATACNYDVNAIQDDGSCTFGIVGCLDPCNAVLGCTDPEATNYNPAVTCDDGGCIYSGGGEECLIVDIQTTMPDCGLCNGEIVLGVNPGVSNGVNQWFFELYNTSSLTGVPVGINATKNLPEEFDDLCDGTYSIRITGLAGDVAGCTQEFTNIVLSSGCTDADGDGIVTGSDPDDNDPCVPNAFGPECTDTDNDGIVDAIDQDPNDPCVPDATVGACLDPVEPSDGPCSIALSTTDPDCDGFCNGTITVQAPGVSLGTNQWFFELYDGANFSGNLIEINATKFPPEVYENLCAGTYSLRITGLAGEVAGCLQEFGSIVLEGCDTSNPDCEQQDVITACTAPLEPVVICATFCDLGANYEITDANSAFDCSVQILNDTCIRYSPLPGFEVLGLDDVTIEACNSNGDCDEILAIVTVGDCSPNAITAINDYVTTDQDESIGINAMLNDGGNNMSICMGAADGQASNGTVQVNADGTFTYTPSAGFSGIDQFTYTICAGNNESSATVVVTIKEDCDATVNACTLPFPYPETIICVDFCAFGVDIEGFETAIDCSIEQIDDVCFSYRPTPDFAGTQQIEVFGCNALGDCETVNVVINVSADCTDPGTERYDEVSNVEDLQENLEKMLIPNVFTPNEDGVNDKFEVKGLNLTDNFVTEFTVFDRFGSEVLKSEDLNFGWDGTMQNTGFGSEVETDTYFYLINITDQNSGETATRTGFIELRR